MNYSKSKREHGFAIIAVMLAIAILCLLIYVGYSALQSQQKNSNSQTEQKNSAEKLQEEQDRRDQKRKDDLSNFATQITMYQANNRGSLPTTTPGPCPEVPDSRLECFIANYLVAGGGWENPSANNPYERQMSTLTDKTTPGSYFYEIGKRCDGEKTVEGKSLRDFAVTMKLENGHIACRDSAS